MHQVTSKCGPVILVAQQNGASEQKGAEAPHHSEPGDASQLRTMERHQPSPNITGLARLPASQIEPSLPTNSPEFRNIAIAGQRFSRQGAKTTSISEPGDNPFTEEVRQRRASLQSSSAVLQNPDWLADRLGFELPNYRFKFSI